MLGFKKNITVCVEKEYNLDIQELISTYVNTIGTQSIYMSDNKVYIGFETRYSTEKVSKIINEKLYKANTNIIGGTIFVEFN